MRPLSADAQEITKALATLFQPGDVIEVRIPKTPQGTMSGYFDDQVKLAKTVSSLSHNYPGVYVTLNTVHDSLLARAANRIRGHVQSTTSDKDIIWRRWLLIDCDPVRHAGISSTDAEHEAALGLARTIRFELREEGWPLPVLGDSGNGGHRDGGLPGPWRSARAARSASSDSRAGRDAVV